MLVSDVEAYEAYDNRNSAEDTATGNVNSSTVTVNSPPDKVNSQYEAKYGSAQTPTPPSLPSSPHPHDDGESQFVLLGFEEDIQDVHVALKAAIDQRQQELALNVWAESLPRDKQTELQAQLTALAHEYDLRLKTQL